MQDDICSGCLKCRMPKCSLSCPVATPVPEIIRLAEAGDRETAARLLFENNPLSAVTSVVCPHESNCFGHCVLNAKKKPVPFYILEQELSREYLMSYKPEKTEKNHRKVAVLGAGPAGITASILLARRGYDVTLIDARDKIGGILRYGIPDFRLPREIIDRYGELLYELGVKFKPNTFVGSTLTLDDMFTDGYRAIFIAVGTAKPNKLGLLGETLGNAHYAIDYLKTPEAYRLGKNVVVIGAGNVALDAARMAVRRIGEGGVVTLINNRRERDMTGNPREIEDALNEGVIFRHLLQTIRVCDDKVIFAAVEPVSDGDNVSYEERFDAITELPADTVIIAIGQGPQGAVVSDTEISRKGRGLLDADENGRTSKDGVFAAGDIVTGPKTVVDAVAFAKKTVGEIENYFDGIEASAAR